MSLFAPRLVSNPFARSCRTAAALLVLAVIPAVVGAWLHPKAPGWQQAPMAGAISWAAAQALPNALWIDARSPDEFARDHVAGALSLPPAEWDAHIEKVLGEWQPGRSLVVYCGGGGCKASQAVAERLRTELGLTEVHVLTGGWSGQTTENAP